MATKHAEISAIAGALSALLSLALLLGCHAAAPQPVLPSPESLARAALDRRVSFDFDGLSLEDALAELLGDAGVPYVDRSSDGLEQRYREYRLQMRLTDVRLETALQWLLWPRAFDFRITATGIDIINDEDPSLLTVEVHPVIDLLDYGPRQFDEDALTEAVTSLIAPADWEEVGGQGVIRATPGALIVAHCPAVQARIAQLLADIRAIGRHQPPVAASANETAIYAALARPVTIDLDSLLPPLDDWLRDATDVNLVIESGWSRKLPSGKLVDVPLGEALERLLPRDATWRVRDDVLYVVEVAEWNYQPFNLALSTVVYPVGGLLRETNAYGGPGAFDGEALIDIVTRVLAPESWDEVGGPGTIAAVPGGLAVTATREVHADLRELLDRLAMLVDPTRQEIQPPPAPANVALLAALQKPVTIAWHGQPLEAGLRELCAQAGIESVLFAANLDDRFPDDQPVTCYARDLPLGHALRLILAPQQQHRAEAIDRNAFTARDGVLEFTRQEVLEMRCFRTWGLGTEADPLIVNLIDPYSWAEVGGPGSLAEVPEGSGIVVAQTAGILAEIESLLSALPEIDDPAAGEVVTLDSTPAEWRLAEVLATPVTLDVRGQPLFEFAAALDRDYGVPVVIAVSDLDTADMVDDLRLDGTFREMSLAAALTHLLDKHGLGWLARHGGLVIATRERLAKSFDTRLYPVPPPPANAGWELYDLADTMPVLWPPTRWRYSSGDDAVCESLENGLIVMQSAAGHDEVRRLLRDLRPALGLPIVAPPAAEAQIAAQLPLPALVDRATMSPAAAIAQLAERHAINIAFDDEVANRLEGRARPLPEEWTLAAALDALLEPRGLGWAVRNEAILIAGRHDKRLTEVRAYSRTSMAALEQALSNDSQEFAGFLEFASRDGTHFADSVTDFGPWMLVRETPRGHARLSAVLPVDGDGDARMAALVEAFQTDPAGGLAAIREALVDGPPPLRVLAAFLLSQSEVGVPAELVLALPADETAVPALLALAAADDYSHVCEPGIVGLEALGPQASAAAPHLAALIARTANERVDGLAFAALGQIGPAAVPALGELLLLDHATVVQALAVLEGLGPEAAPAVPKLIDCYYSRGGRPAGWRICETLSAIGPAAEEAVPHLILSLSEADAPLPNTTAVCRALGAIGARPDVAVPALAAVVANEHFRDRPSLREAACRALGQFGPAALPAEAALQAAAADDNEQVATAARAALDAVHGERH